MGAGLQATSCCSPARPDCFPPSSPRTANPCNACSIPQELFPAPQCWHTCMGGGRAGCCTAGLLPLLIQACSTVLHCNSTHHREEARQEAAAIPSHYHASSKSGGPSLLGGGLGQARHPRYLLPTWACEHEVECCCKCLVSNSFPA